MTYIQEVTLDLNPNSAYPVVTVKQNDVDSRIIKVHYTKDGEKYLIDQGHSIAFRLRKPDMNVVMNDCIIDVDGTVNVTLTAQCLTTAGRGYADLVEFSNGQMLSTVSFILNIQPCPNVMGREAISSNEFLYLKSFIDRGQDTIQEAEAWAIGKRNGVDVETTDPVYHNNAKYWKEQSEAQAAYWKDQSEAWAIGKMGATDDSEGTDVPSSHLTYHNNAKYWADISKNRVYEGLGEFCNTFSASYDITTGELTLSFTINNV